MTLAIEHAPHRSSSPSRASSLFWLLGLPLVGALLWLGLLLALRTSNPLEVTIGRSMQPTLRTGDLAIMRGITPAQLRLGDVVAITVNPGDRDKYGYPEHVLHRVIGITLKDSALVVQTKGDNESEPDPFVTPATQLSRRLAFHIPRVGYLLFYLRSTQGKIALGGLVVLFLVYEGVRWVTDTAEAQLEETSPIAEFAFGFQQLAGAISEYGEHLRSHTKIIQQLGGTTEDLHAATSMQREVLQDLTVAVRALAQGALTQDALTQDALAQGGTHAGLDSPAIADDALAPLPGDGPEAVSMVAGNVTVEAWSAGPDVSASGPDEGASEAPTIDLLGIDSTRVWLRVAGLPSERALLEFGAALEAIPLVAQVTLAHAGREDPVIEIETVAVDALIRRLWRLYGPDSDTGGAHDASMPPDRF